MTWVGTYRCGIAAGMLSAMLLAPLPAAAQTGSAGATGPTAQPFTASQERIEIRPPIIVNLRRTRS